VISFVDKAIVPVKNGVEDIDEILKREFIEVVNVVKLFQNCEHRAA
jgi:hypothetical protein